jgi:hypothetical protein
VSEDKRRGAREVDLGGGWALAGDIKIELAEADVGEKVKYLT